jgi:hypothetical protein
MCGSGEAKDGLTVVAPVQAENFSARDDRAVWCARQLERGNVLLFPPSSFSLPASAREFLLGQRQSSAACHKNIAYRPRSDRITGYQATRPEDAERLREILRDFSRAAERFVRGTLAPYAGSIRRDFASFRPIEERGRPNRKRARNDLLHTDAFPTRPTNGDRILRLFVNLNPSSPRVWITSETFGPLATRYGRAAGLDAVARAVRSRLEHASRAVCRSLGLTVRSPYDRFMVGFHNWLKENDDFQQGCVKARWEFAPGAVWLVYTDMVSHAVLSGQYAVEQTFFVSLLAMLRPELSPAAVLERLCGCPVTD